MSNKYINVLISEGGMIQLLADVDVSVSEEEVGDTIHISDLVYAAILEKAGEQEEAVLPAGEYTIRMMVTVVGD